MARELGARDVRRLRDLLCCLECMERPLLGVEPFEHDICKAFQTHLDKVASEVRLHFDGSHLLFEPHVE